MTQRDDAVMIRLAEPGEDRELKAISYIYSVLEPFSDQERLRILEYLTGRVMRQRGLIAHGEKA